MTFSGAILNFKLAAIMRYILTHISTSEQHRTIKIMSIPMFAVPMNLLIPSKNVQLLWISRHLEIQNGRHFKVYLTHISTSEQRRTIKIVSTLMFVAPANSLRPSENFQLFWISRHFEFQNGRHVCEYRNTKGWGILSKTIFARSMRLFNAL